ncbi:MULTISPECIES: hypothetical protein [unclassified Fusibacter]|uniref:hypothetical protein n=1 Tax=unclassified Fusibacter TaxID=2624464 RepID=UPI0010119761|nr:MULTISPECIES: hypothetical protein [unclassified Fusibacter]MCK8060279.1 hypothetical protein [Fusibacter sp. A2]NPE20432.1 hypothetical protein [Fusibacter sp. A1]RXV63637.1 hypothetical protein DWB64_01280 [Fusibacter sp. A1]
MAEIDEIYQLTADSEKDFRSYSKKGTEAKKDILEKHLSAIVHTAVHSEKLHNEFVKYQFGKTVIVVDHATNVIKLVYWSNRMLKVTADLQKRLEEKFNSFGLSSDGLKLAMNEDVVEDVVEDIVEDVVEDEPLNTVN